MDPAHIAVEGFSDGASYALSVGITNGDLFTHVIAFSPGFMAPAGQQGLPHLFISHGTRDEVLPINACSRKIMPQVERAGYDVLYREFDGSHTVPPEIAREALTGKKPRLKTVGSALKSRGHRLAVSHPGYRPRSTGRHSLGAKKNHNQSASASPAPG